MGWCGLVMRCSVVVRCSVAGWWGVLVGQCRVLGCWLVLHFELCGWFGLRVDLYFWVVLLLSGEV